MLNKNSEAISSLLELLTERKLTDEDQTKVSTIIDSFLSNTTPKLTDMEKMLVMDGVEIGIMITLALTQTKNELQAEIQR